MRTPESAEVFFDCTAAGFSARYQSSPDFQERRALWGRVLARALPGLPIGSVCLDLGCGDGWLGRLVAESGRHVVEIDQSATMLGLARTLAERESLSDLTAYHLASLPLPAEIEAQYAGTAGLILSSSVLEYVPDYPAFLHQCHRLLCPEGIMILSVPNRMSLYRMLERWCRPVLAMRDSYLRYQVHQFSASELCHALHGAGLVPTEVVPYALPFQRLTVPLLRGHRGQWISTMLLAVARKNI